MKKEAALSVAWGEGVGANAGSVFVEIKFIDPEVDTDDMAYWHILSEQEAGVDIASEEDVVVFLDGSTPVSSHLRTTNTLMQFE